MAKRDATGRFSGRAGVYARYRPGYPQAVVSHLRTACGLLPSRVIADVGSGTGKLAEVFLAEGNVVYAVEPNDDMRRIAEEALGGVADFHSVNGTAEETGLGAACVDIVSAGQAFHWFDQERSRDEFRRILKPSGWVVLIWNVRDPAGSRFLPPYEDFLREFSTDYDEVSHGDLNDSDAFRGFFASDYGCVRFPNPRRLDFESVRGVYLSTSYALTPHHVRFPSAMTRLRSLFDEYQDGGMVGMPMRTVVYHGRI